MTHNIFHAKNNWHIWKSVITQIVFNKKSFSIFKFEWLLKFEQCSIVTINASTWEVCGY
jgi:hypothetical protein